MERGVGREVCGERCVERGVGREVCGERCVERGVGKEMCGERCRERDVWREVCGERCRERGVGRYIQKRRRKGTIESVGGRMRRMKTEGGMGGGIMNFVYKYRGLRFGTYLVWQCLHH